MEQISEISSAGGASQKAHDRWIKADYSTLSSPKLASGIFFEDLRVSLRETMVYKA